MFREVEQIEGRLMETKKCESCGKQISYWEWFRYNRICSACNAKKMSEEIRKEAGLL
jgi:plasmid rolling circle replication initiator protein Rep